MEVFEAVREAVGPDFPITVRLSGDEYVPGGLNVKTTQNIAAALEKAGANGLHVSAGNYCSYAKGTIIPPMSLNDAPLVHLAKAVKQTVNIPVIAVAKIRYPKLAHKILAEKSADFIAIGRSLLADPDWPNKAKAGQTKRINHCIACNQGCITRLFENKDVWCTVNPECSREKQFARPRKGAPKKIIVAGGGPAGMTAARTAALRGHRVTLYEEDKKLGGQLFAAAAAPFRPGWQELRKFLTAEIKRLKIKVKLGTSFTADLASKEKPDAVVVAIGSSARQPSIPGIEHKNVVTSRQILLRKKRAQGKVVVVGGGCAGAQTAEFLADKNRPVTIVEMSGQVAEDAPKAERNLLLERLKNKGVKTITNTKVLSIGRTSVTTEQETGTRKNMTADTVVVCLGSYANDSLAEEVKPWAKKVIKVGDAMEPRKVTEAISEGAQAIVQIDR
jgi:NADPH-dependent 2,4-dienoyl-CoA reductase/sulfur reductase-like enzyme